MLTDHTTFFQFFLSFPTVPTPRPNSNYSGSYWTRNTAFVFIKNKYFQIFDCFQSDFKAFSDDFFHKRSILVFCSFFSAFQRCKERVKIPTARRVIRETPRYTRVTLYLMGHFQGFFQGNFKAVSDNFFHKRAYWLFAVSSQLSNGLKNVSKFQPHAEL